MVFRSDGFLSFTLHIIVKYHYLDPLLNLPLVFTSVYSTTDLFSCIGLDMLEVTLEHQSLCSVHGRKMTAELLK
jgi:hypothetical protein